MASAGKKRENDVFVSHNGVKRGVVGRFVADGRRRY
jgi:hypothetical protein